MHVHLTSVYGIGGTACAAQHQAAEIGQQLGFLINGIYHFNISGERENALRARIDGILSSVEPADVFIFPYPSWNDISYDSLLLSRARLFSGVRIIIFVHDVVNLMFQGGSEGFAKTIDLFNRADLLILPSMQMEERLREGGLAVKKVLIQTCWDRPVLDMDLPEPAFRRDLHFSGNPARFPFLPTWQGKTALHVYSGNEIRDAGPLVHWEGSKPLPVLLSLLAAGGFGLVWPGGAGDYYRLINPYKLGDYLSAGIPIFIQKDLSASAFVLSHGIGYAVESLAEVDEIIQSMTEEQYRALCQRLRGVRDLSRGGYYTRKLLVDAVMQVLEG